MTDPSFLSLVPPLVTIVMAILTRQVIPALGTGVFVGMTIHEGFNPFLGLLSTFQKGVFSEITNASNAQVLVVICVIGGFVNQLEQSGGMRAFATRITPRVNSPARAQVSVMLGGLAIFFTDTGNSLILGPIFSPIFDKVRICREKLAFILDSTSAPICVLIPFINWGAYIMSLIEQSFESLGQSVDALQVMMSALPYQFYPLLALAAVPIWTWRGRDFGAMRRAQSEFEKQSLASDSIEGEATTNDPELRSGVTASVVVMPLLTMLSTLGLLLLYFSLTQGKIGGNAIRVSLLLGYLAGAVVAAVILRRQTGSTESAVAFRNGMQRMMPVAIILLFAWSLGEVCSLLGTANYLASLVGDSLPGAMLPAVLFVLGAIVSLSTGSSWGTFAILMPIGVPLAAALDAPMAVTIAAILSGGVFGDHTSPISDTTVLSSMASGCEHASHVNTQLPYALITGVAALLAFVVAGWTTHWLSGLVGLAALLLFIASATRAQEPPAQLAS